MTPRSLTKEIRHHKKTRTQSAFGITIWKKDSRGMDGFEKGARVREELYLYVYFQACLRPTEC